MTVCKPSNLQLKLWKKLELAKYRRREGLFLAEGFKIVQELLKSPGETKALLIMEEKREHWEAFLSTIPENTETYLLSARQWSKLSQDKEPEGIMALAAIPRPTNIFRLSPPGAGYLLLLYHIRNPNNLGAMMRTAHWFGIKMVILSAGSVDFTNSRVVRSSMGSIFHLNIIPEVDFSEVLPRIKKHYTLIISHVRRGIPPPSLSGGDGSSAWF